MNKAKYKVGDRLRDRYTGKKGVVSRINLSETDVNNEPNPTWYYSIDLIGWLFLPEEDLELVTEK